MKLQITKSGGIQMLHDDSVHLEEFGQVKVERASHVEFDNVTQKWYVQSAKTLKMLKADFETRVEALAWEKQYYSPDSQGWKEFVLDETVLG